MGRSPQVRLPPAVVPRGTKAPGAPARAAASPAAVETRASEPLKRANFSVMVAASGRRTGPESTRWLWDDIVRRVVKVSGRVPGDASVRCPGEFVFSEDAVRCPEKFVIAEGVSVRCSDDGFVEEEAVTWVKWIKPFQS